VSKHTPTPWHIARETGDWRTYGIYSGTPDPERPGHYRNCKQVLPFYDCDPQGMDRHRHEADAEFMLRAANTHDDLLAALKAVSEYYDDIGPVLGDSKTAHGERMVRVKVRDAIAKAEGTSDA